MSFKLQSAQTGGKSEAKDEGFQLEEDSNSYSEFSEDVRKKEE